MGWYGMTSNEKPKADWDEEFKSYVQTLLDNEEHIKANNTGGHHLHQWGTLKTHMHSNPHFYPTPKPEIQADPKATTGVH